MNEFFDQLSLDLEGAPCEVGIAGLSEPEIAAVRSLYDGRPFPEYYVEFLRRLGARAGVLWMGTDAFYPQLMKIGAWALELLADNNASHLMPEGAIVIAMHQGYQMYWLEPSDMDDPTAASYIEGSSDIANRWVSFSEFISAEATEAINLWLNKDNR
jgi:hypothetical protein